MKNGIHMCVPISWSSLSTVEIQVELTNPFGIPQNPKSLVHVFSITFLWLPNSSLYRKSLRSQTAIALINYYFFVAQLH